jgi:hypothetical protein
LPSIADVRTAADWLAEMRHRSAIALATPRSKPTPRSDDLNYTPTLPVAGLNLRHSTRVESAGDGSCSLSLPESPAAMHPVATFF